MNSRNYWIAALSIEVQLKKVALDCMVSPRFASALNALYGDSGFEFILVQDLVPPRSSDDHWSDVFKRFGGEFVVSGDTKIAYKPRLACSFIDNGFVSIFLEPPWQHMLFHLQFANLAYWWPTFATHLREQQAGTLWRAPCKTASGAIRLGVTPLKELKVPAHVLDKIRLTKVSA